MPYAAGYRKLKELKMKTVPKSAGYVDRSNAARSFRGAPAGASKTIPPSKPRTAAANPPPREEFFDFAGDEIRAHEKKHFRSFGEQLQAIARRETGGGPDSRLIRAPTGAGEVDPSGGGFLVQVNFVEELIESIYSAAILARFAIAAKPQNSAGRKSRRSMNRAAPTAAGPAGVARFGSRGRFGFINISALPFDRIFAAHTDRRRHRLARAYGRRSDARRPYARRFRK